MTALVLNLDSVIHLTDEQFYQLCQTNRDIRLECTAKRELIVMAPTGGETGSRNSKLNQRLANWSDVDGTGVTFDSSSGFKLPNGAERSPNAAWVKLERWESLAPEQRQKFPPLAPDFAVELRSASDDLKPLREKMQDYINNGTRLGWLINPKDQQVEIYRSSQAVEVLQLPISLSGEDVLPGFILDLGQIL